MNKNIAITFALITILLVAVLFEDDGALPTIAEAAKVAHAETAAQDSGSDTAGAGELEQAPRQTDMISQVAMGQNQPSPPSSEPDPPFIQPEPLK